MDFDRYGRVGLPTLVCVPGLLGGPGDFEAMLPAWSNHFDIFVLKPEYRNISFATVKEMQEVSFNTTAEDIRNILLKNQISQALLVGISLGGKVIYDFAIKFPKMFIGGVVSDVGPGSFEESDLFKFVDNFVRNAPLHLPWPDFKKHLADHIPERSMRALIQTQVFYPDQKPPAIWKTGMQHFSAMLQRQAIDNQVQDLENADLHLYREGKFFKVLYGSAISGIGKSSLAVLQKLKSVRLNAVANSSHFLHISHRTILESAVLNALKPSSVDSLNANLVLDSQV